MVTPPRRLRRSSSLHRFYYAAYRAQYMCGSGWPGWVVNLWWALGDVPIRNTTWMLSTTLLHSFTLLSQSWAVPAGPRMALQVCLLPALRPELLGVHEVLHVTEYSIRPPKVFSKMAWLSGLAKRIFILYKQDCIIVQHWYSLPVQHSKL
jgi:hypothetical protein